VASSRVTLRTDMYNNGKTILVDIASDHVQELGRNKLLCKGGEFLSRTLYTIFSATICVILIL